MVFQGIKFLELSERACPQTPQPPPATFSQQLAHSTLDNLLVIKEYPDFTYQKVLIYYYFSGMLVICRKTIFFIITHPQGPNYCSL